MKHIKVPKLDSETCELRSSCSVTPRELNVQNLVLAGTTTFCCIQPQCPRQCQCCLKTDSGRLEAKARGQPGPLSNQRKLPGCKTFLDADHCTISFPLHAVSPEGGKHTHRTRLARRGGGAASSHLRTYTYKIDERENFDPYTWAECMQVILSNHLTKAVSNSVCTARV